MKDCDAKGTYPFKNNLEEKNSGKEWLLSNLDLTFCLA
jgi:hypothetical protein